MIRRHPTTKRTDPPFPYTTLFRSLCGKAGAGLYGVMTMLADRVLPLSGVHNFRDYGGYAVEGGGRLRDGMLWRSAHHVEAVDEDLAAIDALGIETIIDLRGDDEREIHLCRRSENFAGRVLFAGGLPAGLAPHLQAAGGAIEIGRASCRARACQYV